MTAQTVAPTPSLSADDEPVQPRIVRTVARGLEVPWGITFLLDGSALVGERDSTRVLSVASGGRVSEVGRVEAAAPQGEAGLLGLAASPSYDEDRTVFAYVTTESDNRVVRFTVQDGRMGEVEPVLKRLGLAAALDQRVQPLDAIQHAGRGGAHIGVAQKRQAEAAAGVRPHEPQAHREGEAVEGGVRRHRAPAPPRSAERAARTSRPVAGQRT